MNTPFVKPVISVVLAAVLLTGCYGRQLVKGPIYTEQVHEKVDSLAKDQQRTQRLIRNLQLQLENERESRVRREAQLGLTITELEESIRILLSRMEDQVQLQSRGTGTRRSYPPPERSVTEPPRVTTGVDDSTTASAADSAKADAANAAAAADELYRNSYMDVTQGNYSLAIQGLQNYLVRYPSGPHVSEVHYYLGECYYAENRHLEAVGEFQYVIREFSESRLVPAAYLKSGLCYAALEERGLAERSFRELIDTHPDTEEANQARDELKRYEG